jgi:acyl-lipid omega-6 desaturase (Delta-12 desaturase)
MIETTIDSLSDSDRFWQKVVRKYSQPDLRKSIWQIVNSLIPYLFIWFLIYKSLEYPYWVTFLLILPACGFLVRIFIIFHDCGHGAFFKSKKANDIVGRIMGILTFTPYHKWHHQHQIHHATAGNLDKRGVGDIWTLTVDEYIKSSRWRRIIYRVFRNPFVMFTIGPVFVVFVMSRLTKKYMTRTEKRNVYFTNIMLLVIGTLMSFLFGIQAYLLIQLPMILITFSIGLWLFYIQHQFDDVSWERDGKWDYKVAAIKGSSFLKLHPVLQWFTGNIGFHHIHHLSSRIPNYNLARCHYENELFKDVKPLILSATFKALKFHFWDEVNQQMISYRQMTVNYSV